VIDVYIPWKAICLQKLRRFWLWIWIFYVELQ